MGLRIAWACHALPLPSLGRLWPPRLTRPFFFFEVKNGKEMQDLLWRLWIGSSSADNPIEHIKERGRGRGLRPGVVGAPWNGLTWGKRNPKGRRSAGVVVGRDSVGRGWSMGVLVPCSDGVLLW